MIQTLANQLNEEQQSQILDALSAGLNISAIKLYREATGCDLKTAKDFIDDLIAELNHDGSATPRNPIARAVWSFSVGFGYIVVAVGILGTIGCIWRFLLS